MVEPATGALRTARKDRHALRTHARQTTDLRRAAANFHHATIATNRMLRKGRISGDCAAALRISLAQVRGRIETVNQQIAATLSRRMVRM